MPLGRSRMAAAPRGVLLRCAVLYFALHIRLLGGAHTLQGRACLTCLHPSPRCPCSMALLMRWLLLCIGKLSENAPEVTAMALREQVSLRASVVACRTAWQREAGYRGAA